MRSGAVPKVSTCLAFSGNAEEAAGFYVSLLDDSRIEDVTRMNGEALVIAFTLAGTPYIAMNAPMEARFTPATSISILTHDQGETDHLSKVLAEGGEQGPCGWLTDRYGLSWQIVPALLPELMASPDEAAKGRVFAALMGMTRIDHAALERAFAGPESVK